MVIVDVSYRGSLQYVKELYKGKESNKLTDVTSKRVSQHYDREYRDVY
jgi:hypothetical protein